VRFQVFLLFLPHYATLHLSLLVHLNSAKLGHHFWLIWGQNLIKFLGFWSTRFESTNRAYFGYELEGVQGFFVGLNYSRFRVVLQQKGGEIGDFEGVISRTDLGTDLNQERGAFGGFLKGDFEGRFEDWLGMF
jgi:hypothetical protein